MIALNMNILIDEHNCKNILLMLNSKLEEVSHRFHSSFYNLLS
jgi:hypothetical protein